MTLDHGTGTPGRACRASASGGFMAKSAIMLHEPLSLTESGQISDETRGWSPPGKPLGTISEFSTFGSGTIHGVSRIQQETSHADAVDDPRRFRPARNGAGSRPAGGFPPSRRLD